jgi:uncharacterized protein (DUF2336 family)
MVPDRFLRWVAAAPARARADAARALVLAYGQAGADPQRAEHLDEMTAILLDDPSITVRRALAEAAARSVDVPRALVVALASDDAPVSVPVLVASPLLGAADLVEAVAAGDADAQSAVASRPGLPTAAAAALVEAGHRTAVLTLCRNGTARLTRPVLRRVLARFGDDAEMREALLRYAAGDPGLHHDLVEAATRALTAFAVGCAWMSPTRADHLGRELRDRSVVTVASGCRAALGREGATELVAHLRDQGHLTPALLLRALLSGNRDLFEATLALLGGTPPARAAGHMRAPNGLGFAALYRRAALPPGLLPVFRAALEAGVADMSQPALSRVAVTRVLATCASGATPELARAAALLRRLEAEALRESVRLSPEPIDEPIRHPGAPDLARFQRQPPAPLRLRSAA